MIRVSGARIKALLSLAIFVAALTAGYAFAQNNSVQTFTDEAVPTNSGVSNGQPLSAGDLSMQDVLAAGKATKKKPPPSYVPIPLPAPVAAAAGTPVKPSAPIGLLPPQPAAQTVQAAPAAAPGNSTSSMLMQGMQSIFGAPSPAAPQAPLHAPGSAVSATAAAPAAPKFPAAAAIAPAAPAAVAQQQPAAPAPTVAVPKTEKVMEGCVPQTTSWTKSCVEAGYPENYVGQIRGETRTTCPAGNLQDVWVSNGCVPPENSSEASAGPATLTSASPTAASSASAPAAAPVAAVESSEPTRLAPEPVSTTAEIDANCGSSNGLAVTIRPRNGLCAAGSASSVSGNGPWTWNCNGANGGMTVSCAAPVATVSTSAPAPVAAAASAPAMVSEDAQCGSSNGVSATSAPKSDLCLKGTASRVNGSGPWTWACSGTNGGAAMSCSAPKKIDGICGSSNGTTASQLPTSGLCNSGLASAVTGNGPWAWTCSGVYGGQAATCSAMARTDAVCGPATLSGQNEKPKNGLCSEGVAGAISGTGPWMWTCSSPNGGASVSCEGKARQNGVCGSAHGASFATTPASSDLCAAGTPSKISGSGPWNWSCSGSQGGDVASCAASRTKVALAVPAALPPTSAPAATSTPSAASPAATASTPAPAAPAAAPSEPATPAASSAPISLVNSALCGSATNFVAIEAPSKNLCKSGTASAVAGRGPWAWTCKDGSQQSQCATLSLGGESSGPAASTAAPAAPAAVSQSGAACGAVSSQGSNQQPTSDLCAAGTPSKVVGSGPWTWTCTEGKSKTSCQAEKPSDGACGTANGIISKAAPQTNLCTSGKATPVHGSGPWAWSCVGAGSGSTVSCSASTPVRERIDGTCGVAAGMSATTKPSGDYCASGIASAIYGDGPWTWTCSGENGGNAATCAAMKNMPSPQTGHVVNGLCGSANGMPAGDKPTDNLCTGGIATTITGNGPWEWNCMGENSGMTVSCTAPLQPPAPISGVCGGANGVPTLTTPKSGLCSAGIISAVSGHGPWTWSCSGVNGGTAVGCVAPVAGSVGASRPLPSMTTQLPASSSNRSESGLVTPHLGGVPDRSVAVPRPAPSSVDTSVPAQAPDLPDDTQNIPPPPVRDFIQPAPALRPGAEGASQTSSGRMNLDPDLAMIPFPSGKDTFDAIAQKKLDRLADLMLKNVGARITLTAYADNSNSTPREARRLSLSRALAVRDYLGNKGVSSALIDVRALGANVPSGEPDRVDIKVN